MSLIKRRENDFPSFSSLFNDFFDQTLLNWGNSNFSSTHTSIPSVNLKETKDNFEVEVAAPGLEKKDFQITLDGNYLTISSSKEEKQEHTEPDYKRKEFSYQSFRRTIKLPEDVIDDERIAATYENGLLQLTIPKKGETKGKTSRLIEIR